MPDGSPRFGGIPMFGGEQIGGSPRFTGVPMFAGEPISAQEPQGASDATQAAAPATEQPVAATEPPADPMTGLPIGGATTGFEGGGAMGRAGRAAADSTLAQSAAGSAVSSAGETLTGISEAASHRAQIAPYYEDYQNWPTLPPDQKAALQRRIMADPSLALANKEMLLGHLASREGGGEAISQEEFAGPDPTTTGMYKTGQAIKGYGERTFPLTDEQRGSVTGQVGSLVGGIAPALVASAIPGVGPVLGATQFGLSMAGSEADAARKKGATDLQTSEASGKGFALGTVAGAANIEAVLAPVARSAPGILGWAKDKLIQAARGGAAFATIGEAQTYLASLIEKSYDPAASYSFDPKRLVAELIGGAGLGVLHPLHQEPAAAPAAEAPTPPTDGTGTPPPPPGAPPAGPRAAPPVAEPVIPPAPPATPAATKQRETADLQAWMDGKRPPAEPLYQPEPNTPVTITLASGDKMRGLFVKRDGEAATITMFDEPGNPESVRGKTITGSARSLKFAPLELTEAEQQHVAANEAATSPLNDKPQPTPAQEEAENFQLGHINVQGLDISITHPEGAVRNGQPSPAHYGYLKGTVGAESRPGAIDQVDAYVGPNPKASKVFVIDQIDPATGKFDEIKSLVGFDSEAHAIATYARAFSDGSGPSRMGAISGMPMPRFKRWLKEGDTTKPFKFKEGAPEPEASPAPVPEPPGRAEIAAPVPTRSFEDMQREYRERQAKADSIAAENDGPVVLQSKHRADMGALIHPSADEPGKWQYTFFDRDGFSGHTVRDTKQEAVRLAMQEGFGDTNRNMLREFSGTDRWNAGNARADANMATHAEPAATATPSLHPNTPQVAKLLATTDLRPKIADIAKAGKMTVEDAKRTLAYLAGKGGLIRQTGVNTYRKLPRRTTPMDIAEFLASKDGIRDDGGELKARDLDRKFIPGIGKLVRGGGMTLDAAALRAWEAGYFPEHGPVSEGNRPTIDHLLDALDRNTAGNRVFAERDREQVASMDAAKLQAEERGHMERLADSLAVEHTKAMPDEELANRIREAERAELLKKPDAIVREPEAHDLEDESDRLDAALEEEGRQADNAVPLETPHELGIPFEPGRAESEAHGAARRSDEGASGEPGREGGAPRAGDPGQREAAPGAGAPPAGVGTSKRLHAVDRTDQGEQPVIPGAEKLSEADAAKAAKARADANTLAVRQQQSKMRSGKAQKEADEGGLFGKGPKQGSLFQVAQPFFSALTRAVEAVRQPRAPAAQWRGIIDGLKTRGVREEELAWSGVRDWLGEQKGSVSKEAILDHLRENEVRVEEVMKGGGEDPNAVVEQKYEERERVGHQLEHAVVGLPGAEFVDAAGEKWDGRGVKIGLSQGDLKLADLPAEVRPAAEAYLAADQAHERAVHAAQVHRDGGGPKFSSYTLPGSKNYREMLLTMPHDTTAAQAAFDAAGRRRIELFDALKQANDDYGRSDDRALAARDKWTAASKTETAAGIALKAAKDSQFTAGHFDEPNVLAHVRMDDRTGPNGEKILHVAEIQSDWAQRGRKHGFGELPPVREARRYEFGDITTTETEHQYIATGPDGETVKIGKGTVASRREAQEYAARYFTDNDIRRYQSEDIARSNRETPVPDAPFIKDTGAWSSLALKRILRHAAERGYDKVSWDTGETQNDRYDLSKQVHSIHWARRSDGKYDVTIAPKDGGPISRDALDERGIEDLIGKEHAERIVNDKGTGFPPGGLHVAYGDISGEGLKIGGEGMKGFYDRILPAAANKIGKPFGARVGETTVGISHEGVAYEGPTPTDRQIADVRLVSNLGGSGRYRSPITGENLEYQINRVANSQAIGAVQREMKNGKTFAEAMAIEGHDGLAEIFGGKMVKQATSEQVPVHSIAITDAMRQSAVEKGFPLFRPGEPTPLLTEHRATIRAEVAAEIQRLAPGTIASVLDRHSISYETSTGARRNVDLNGSYLDGVINVALSGPDPLKTANHEVIHALRDMGLIRDSEWGPLSRVSQAHWMPKYDIEARYGHYDETHPNPTEARIEEGVAEAFADFDPKDVRAWIERNGGNLPPAVVTAAKRVWNFFQKVRAMLAGKGFHSLDDAFAARDTFERIQSGEIGKRPWQRDPFAEGQGVAAEQREGYRGEVTTAAEYAARDAGHAREPQSPERKQAKMGFTWGFENAALRRGVPEDITQFTAAARSEYRKGGQAGREWSAKTGVDQLKARDGKPRMTQVADGEREPPAEYPPGVDHAKPGRALIDSAKKFVRGITQDLQMKVAPMATGSDPARVVAKDFANNLRVSQYRWTRADEHLDKAFTPEQRKRMWTAGDEQSVLEQTGEEYPPQAGLGALTLEERAAVDQLHALGEPLWEQAKAAGIIKGEGLPSYMPRMFVDIAEDGTIGRLTGGSRTAGAGGRGLDTMGRNLTTAGPKHREHLTAAGSEIGAKGVSPGATLVRDIRALPLAYSRLERAIAGKELINSIREIGTWTGRETVREGGGPGYFTLDHPAFQVYEPKMRDRAETGAKGGTREIVLDDQGSPVFVKRPIYVSKEFEGPLRAVLTKESGATYNAMMALKGKTMSVIMYSPLIHNEVEWGRAFGAMPIEMLKVGMAEMPLPGGMKMPVPVPKIYRDGNRIKQDQAQMVEAIQAGLVPIGHRGFNQDITGIAEAPNIKPGRSLTAKALGFPFGLVSDKAGSAVKRGIDKAGDIWHNTLLWDRVGDLQMGLYSRVLDAGMKKGLSREQAVIVAAHEANRFAGALPNESMSAGARKVANFVLFSRTFTLGNIGVMKDAINGLPRDLQAQLRATGADAKAQQAAGDLAKSFARRKAVGVIIKDIAIAHLGVALVQSAINLYQSGGDWEKEKQGYADRWHRLVETSAQSLWNVANPFADLNALSPSSENEPSKESRVDVGPNDQGTEIYARLPTGKIGEEFEGYLTEPLEMLRRKVGTIMRPLIQIYENDQGFGRKVYNPGDNPVKEVADAVWHLLSSQAPVDAIKGVRDIVTGEGDRATNIAKAVGPLAGITVSQGAPGGKAVGELYAAQGEHFARVREAMPDINRMIQHDDLAGALAKMSELGLDRGQMRSTIAHAVNPASRLSKGKLRDAELYMTPEQQGRMSRAIAAGAARMP
jgi:hypothetical protein